MRQSIFCASLLMLLGCTASRQSAPLAPRLLDHSTFLLSAIATDAAYGYSKEYPVKVGGAMQQQGSLNERRYLNALAGPEGEPITYNRRGSCCHFKTRNSPLGGGLLDIYEVIVEGSYDTLLLYLNMYDAGPLMAPVGFTIKPVLRASGDHVVKAVSLKPPDE